MRSLYGVRQKIGVRNESKEMTGSKAGVTTDKRDEINCNVEMTVLIRFFVGENDVIKERKSLAALPTVAYCYMEVQE